MNRATRTQRNTSIVKLQRNKAEKRKREDTPEVFRYI